MERDREVESERMQASGRGEYIRKCSERANERDNPEGAKGQDKGRGSAESSFSQSQDVRENRARHRLDKSV